MSSGVFSSGRNVRRPIPEVVLRTRRNVMEAANAMQVERVRRRRQIGIALFVLAVLIVLVTPALWNAAKPSAPLWAPSAFMSALAPAKKLLGGSCFWSPARISAEPR